MSDQEQQSVNRTQAVNLKASLNNQLSSNYSKELTQQQSQIQDVYKDIHQLIESVNQQLVKTFKKQETNLLDNYKNEMIHTQKELKTLQETMNEEEMKKKMIKRKEELEDQRKKFIDQSFAISNKCKEFQQHLQQVQNLTYDLQEELKFLDEQLVYSDQNNKKQKEELENLKKQILQHDPNYQFMDEDQIWDQVPIKQQSNSIFTVNQTNNMTKQAKSQTNKITNQSINQIHKFTQNYESPYSKQTFQKQESVPKNSSDITNAKLLLQKQLEINKKLQSFLNSPCFQQSEIEVIFNRCVNNVKKESNDPFSKASQCSNIKKIKQKIQEQIQQNNSDSYSMNQMVSSSSVLTDIQKKKIMEEFLEDSTIKKFIYSILTQSNN